MIDKEFEESLLELRSVLCDERIAKYCIENDIAWSDSAMTGSPIEVLGLAKELIQFGFCIGGRKMTEKQGVLLVDVPEPSYAKYYYLEYSDGTYSLCMTNVKEIVVSEAVICTK